MEGGTLGQPQVRGPQAKYTYTKRQKKSPLRCVQYR